MKKTKYLLILVIAFFTSSTLLANWTDAIKLGGDFRYRLESIDEDGSSSKDRSRIRARLKMKAKVNEDAHIHIRLTSGDKGNTSANETLGDNSDNDPFDLDWAYFSMKNIFDLEALEFMGGKLKNPLYRIAKNELLWDGDLTPEGVALKYKMPIGNIKSFVTVANFQLKDQQGTNAELTTVQVGGKVDVGVHLEMMLGFYNYNNKISDIDVSGSSKGNPTVPGVNPGELAYASQYSLMELSLGTRIKIMEKPLKFYGTAVKNDKADTDDMAYVVGVMFGKTKEKYDFKIGYSYRKVESQSLLGAYSDGDFNGGSVDAKGHEIRAAYQIADKMTLGIKLIDNEFDLTGNTQDNKFQLAHLDLVFKF